jgi:hypothetical protein
MALRKCQLQFLYRPFFGLLLLLFSGLMLLRFMFTIVCDIKLHKQWHTAVDMKIKPKKNLEQKIVTKIDISNEKEETISLM